MSQDTYVEMVRKSNTNEKKILGENVWKYIVQSDPSLLRFAMSECNFSPAKLNMEERVSMVTKCYDVTKLVYYDPDRSVEFVVKVLQKNPRAYAGCNKELKKVKEVEKLVPDIVKKYRYLINEVPADQRTGYLEIIAAPFFVPNFPLKDREARKLLAINHLQTGTKIKKILDACAFGRDDPELKTIFEERGFLNHWVARFGTTGDIIAGPPCKKRRINPTDV
jgi:hypothetical protein